MVILIIILQSGTYKAPEFCQSDCVFIKNAAKIHNFRLFMHNYTQYFNKNALY